YLYKVPPLMPAYIYIIHIYRHLGRVRGGDRKSGAVRFFEINQLLNYKTMKKLMRLMAALAIYI
ncbi:MAG: hypothetical protein K2H65_00700, partial [Bacteroidales bacterium]|nr:hypothetical protein [Bacteroidales bacterium]